MKVRSDDRPASVKGDKRSVHVYMSQGTWRSLKLGSIDTGKTMSAIIVGLVEEWARENHYL